MTKYRTEFDRHYDKAMALLRESGSTESAYQYIRTIEDEDYRARTFQKVAQSLAEQGNLDEALNYSQAISGPRERADSLLEIGRTLKTRGKVDQAKNVFGDALQAAEEIVSPYDKAAVFLQLADELEALGGDHQGLVLVNRAVDLARPHREDLEASKTLRASARTLAKWNRIAEAIGTAKLIDDRWAALRDMTLEEVQGRGQFPIKPTLSNGD